MGKIRQQAFSIIRFSLGWPLSAIALFFIVKLIFSQTGIILPNLKDINLLMLFYGFFSFLLYFFLRSYFWQQILRAKGHTLSLKETTFLFAWAELKRYAPGKIWPFLGRTTLFSQKGVNPKKILSSLFLEIQFFLLASLLVSLFAISFIVYNLFPRFFPLELLIPLVIFATILISIFYLYNPFFEKYLKIPLLFKHLLPNFSPKTNFTLLIISISYMLFFSLGTYLTISSLFFLTPIHFLTFIGFFTFSFLVGYLSIIMPMGLGAREAIMTLGLSKFIPLSLAGFASLFTRIVFIFSELIFLLLSFLWKNAKNRLVLGIENFIRTHKHEVILLFLVLVYIIYFTSVSFLRYDNFYTGRFDLGNMDQTVWNTTHGRIFQFTDPNGTNNISRLAFHADFILIFLSPFYFLWSSPKMLLLIQTLVLSLGAFFIFLIAKDTLKNKNLSLLFSFLFLLNPALQYTNLYDFHPVTLATTLLLATFYFLKKRKYLWFLLFAILSALTKEQVWIIIALFALYFIFTPFSRFPKDFKRELLGMGLFLGSLLIFYYLVWHAIPNTRGATHFALSYYSDFGATPTNIVKNIIFSPHKVLEIILQKERLNYLFQLFLPLGFLPIFSPFLFLFALPDLLINLLSNNSQLHQIYFQYSATITPFLFISAIYGLKNIKNLSTKIYRLFIFCLLFSTLYCAYVFGPLPGAKNPNLEMIVKPQPYRTIIDGFLTNIPKKYSIAATNNLGSHLSHRQEIFTIPVGMDKADFVIFLLNDPSAQPSLAAQKKMADKMKKDKNYIEVFRQNDFIVFEKRNLYLQFPPKINKVTLLPFAIPTLQHRDYQGGKIVIEKEVTNSNFFKSYVISYPSDGLKLYALMNIPRSKKPENGYPVLIINHGYVNPKAYDTLNSYKNISDYFSSNGFLVLKPDYRGNGNSEVDNPALMRFLYPIDVLNLISSLTSLDNIDTNRISLFGHSLGGEVTLKVLEVLEKNKEFSQKVQGAVLWAPVTDPQKWFAKSHLSSLPEFNITPFPYKRTFEILGTPEKNPLLWQSLSPLSYLSDISSPIQILQGTDDETVPYNWSIELYDNLVSLNKNAKLILYPGDDHSLSRSWSKAALDSLEYLSIKVNKDSK